MPSIPAQTLRALRRRWAWQQGVESLASAVLMAGALWALWAIAARYLSLSPWNALALAVLTVAALLGTVLRVIARYPALPQMARWVDHAGQTRDRFTTALAFAEPGAAERAAPWQALAREECERYLAGRDFRPLLPWRLPRALPWLAVPLCAVALLVWDARQRAELAAARVRAAQEAVEPTIVALQKLAQEWQRVESAQDPTQRGLAEEISRRAERLRQEVRDPKQAEEAVLRELSQLEELAREAAEKRPAGALTPEEQQALAQALQGQEATREVGQALAQQGPAAAAEALQAVSQEGRAQGQARTPEQVEEALRKGLERLGQKQNSEAIRKLREAGRQGGQALQKQMGDTLRKSEAPRAAQAGKPGSGAKPGAPKDLKSLAAALQNMKSGEAQPGDDNQGSQGGGEAPAGPPPDVQVYSDGQATAGAQGAPQNGPPSGQAGTERDFGTTESPLGEKQQAGAKPGRNVELKGQQGESGQVLSQTAAGGPEQTQAQRQYRALYEAMAPAAEDAVVNEEIPLGSRLLIRRYFEAIRPRE